MLLVIGVALASGCTAVAEEWPSHAASPTWSPDSKSIAYVLWHQRATARTEFDATARVIDVADDRDRELIEASGWHPELAWSPDGRWLAVPSDRDRRRGTSCFTPPCDVLPELYLMRRDGGAMRRLTNNRADDFAPAWSPDGRRVAFISGRDRPPGVRTWRDVYTTPNTGGDVVRITNDRAWEYALAWSEPDRLRITRDNGTRFLVSAETLRRTPLPAEPLLGASQAVSERTVAPRSKAVAWLSTKDRNGESCDIDSGTETCAPNAEVYLRTPAGRQVRVTRTKSNEYDLAWSPDGRRLAFATEDEIWIVNATGTGLRRVSAS